MQIKGSNISFSDILKIFIHSLENNDQLNFIINKNIHHLILDESQDTNIESWYIIYKIIENISSNILFLSVCICRFLTFFFF